MEQDRLIQRSTDPIYVYYREIQQTDLHTKTIDATDSILNFNDVLDGFERQSGLHNFEELEMAQNPKLMLNSIFDSYPDHDQQQCAMLVNDFCRSMQTSARQEGKYAVLIVTADSIFVCHTDSKEKSITKSVDVIERLLDTDNVNKYVEFRNQDDGETNSVRHFEQHKTKSLSDWLGIEPFEIAYEDAGEVSIFTEIDDSTAAFQYSKEEFEDKFLHSDSQYELIEDVFRTPQNEYPIKQIQFGRRNYDSTDDFLQDFYSLYYDVRTYREHFNQVSSSMEPWQSKVYDHENKVTEGKDGKRLVVKNHDRFNIVFAGRQIELSAQWRIDLTQKFLDGTPVQLMHAGEPFSEEPVNLGCFEIYNDVELGDIGELNRLYSTLRKGGTGKHLSDILAYVIFVVAAEWSDPPLSRFFPQLASKYANRLDAEGVVIRDEDDLIEFKSNEWFGIDDNDELAERITKEIQGNTQLLIGGIDEEDQRIRPINRNRFDSERNAAIQDKVESLNGNHHSIDLKSVRLGNGDCLLFVFSVQGDQTFGLDAIA
ncbi:hypothetical protein HZS55_22085 [Halosimplex rubrum]|uniref:Uncharacterized protein n=1 Tax=Halosimplex rubrum TaxID=869889 RepID=A0A7D5P8B7_9EURY|nr:hypothetical protein [Halosimplex rubrum]QLH79818.1 hypothetical protein HZS55_22085 [Halosimplex rubrum]